MAAIFATAGSAAKSLKPPKSGTWKLIAAENTATGLQEGHDQVRPGASAPIVKTTSGYLVAVANSGGTVQSVEGPLTAPFGSSDQAVLNSATVGARNPKRFKKAVRRIAPLGVRSRGSQLLSSGPAIEEGSSAPSVQSSA